MVSHQTSSTGTEGTGGTSPGVTGAGMRQQYETADRIERAARRLDEPVRRKTGISLFHVLTLASIGASVSLFIAGRKDLAIFIGLWPPTFQALRAASESHHVHAGEENYR
ncbi:MAG: hypothetical protein AB7U82_04665 [Blastocatellales bacterium]